MTPRSRTVSDTVTRADDWDNTDYDLVQQLTGSEPHHMRLRRVEPQSTATQPGVDVIQPGIGR